MPFELHRFNVGDCVRIIDEPDWDCDVGWCDEMNQYCGQIARVVTVRPSGNVRLDIDGSRFLWSSEIVQLFECPSELPDLDPISPEALSELYG